MAQTNDGTQDRSESYAKDPTPQTTKLEKIIDDINKMSRDDQRFDNKDYETLRPGILEKLAALIHSEASRIALEAIGENEPVSYQTGHVEDLKETDLGNSARNALRAEQLQRLASLTAPEGDIDTRTPRKPETTDCDNGVHRPCFCAGRKECHDCGMEL